MSVTEKKSEVNVTLRDALYEVFNKRLRQGRVYDLDELLFDEFVNKVLDGESYKIAEFLVDSFLSTKKGYLEDFKYEHNFIPKYRVLSDEELIKEINPYLVSETSDGEKVILYNF
jgi:hypothetical protein